MFGRWKRILLILLLAIIVYMGLSTPGILKTEKFFREKDPNSSVTPKVCDLLADVSFLTLRYKLAIGIINRNIDDFPYDSSGKDWEYTRAVCYEKLGDYEKAIGLYEDFLLEYPKDRRYDSIQGRIAKLKVLNRGA